MDLDIMKYTSQEAADSVADFYRAARDAGKRHYWSVRYALWATMLWLDR